MGQAQIQLDGRTRAPSLWVMSYPMPEPHKEDEIVNYHQARSGIPSMGQLWTPGPAHPLWADPLQDYWTCCRPADQVITAKAGPQCQVCQGCNASELVPCCWCDSWVHLICSYAIKMGVRMPLSSDKPIAATVLVRSDDATVPEDNRGSQAMPVLASPRINEAKTNAETLMYYIEAC